MIVNPPPLPVVVPATPRPSLMAYVWRGDKYDDIGLGLTSGDGHRVTFHLGAAQDEVIELRAVEEDFYPGHLRPHVRGPQPTFTAFFADTECRAGTAWPHDDGKGHRLKLRCSLADGTVIELRSSGHYTPEGDNRPTRSRKPSHRPRTNA